MKLYVFYFKSKNQRGNPYGNFEMLYGWTPEKEVAEEFLDTRNEEVFRMVKTKMERKNFEIFKKKYSSSQIEMQPLTDGTTDIYTPMTWDELSMVNAVVEALENLAFENWCWLNQSFFRKEVKEKLHRYNRVTQNDDGEVSSIVNTLKIFIEAYHYTL